MSLLYSDNLFLPLYPPLALVTNTCSYSLRQSCRTAWIAELTRVLRYLLVANECKEEGAWSYSMSSACSKLIYRKNSTKTFEKIALFMYTCAWALVCVPCMCRRFKEASQMRASDPLKLVSQAVLSHPAWVLGTKARSSVVEAFPQPDTENFNLKGQSR